jgi:hypothetical protein
MTIVIEKQTALETGYYHTGEEKLLLKGIESKLYMLACDLFLENFDIEEECFWEGEYSQYVDFTDYQKDQCVNSLMTGISGFDFGFPAHLKPIAIRHCRDILTNPKSVLPALGYNLSPVGIASEALALAPLYWLSYQCKIQFSVFSEDRPEVLNHIWETAVLNDFFQQEKDISYYGWETEEEQRSFFEENYPKSANDFCDSDNKDVNKKWMCLIREIADRMIHCMDEDWNMFFVKPEIYQEYIKDSELASFLPNSPKTEPQNTVEIEADDNQFIPSFSIKKLAKTLLGDHNNLPDSPGIYFALDAASRVWYVGISTTSLRNRHAKHEKISEFKEHKIQHIAYFTWTDANDLEEWEIGYIRKFDPPLNMNHCQKELPQIVKKILPVFIKSGFP